jgi:hypothetical protein
MDKVLPGIRPSSGANEWLEVKKTDVQKGKERDK